MNRTGSPGDWERRARKLTPPPAAALDSLPSSACTILQVGSSGGVWRLPLSLLGPGFGFMAMRIRPFINSLFDSGVGHDPGSAARTRDPFVTLFLKWGLKDARSRRLWLRWSVLLLFG